MNLSIPGVGSEPGPQYASDVNSSLTLIDQHDHSPGRGVQITPAGININSTLNFNDEAATNLTLVSFEAGGLPTTTVQAVSVAPVASINELFYTDSNGTQTQITSNGVVNATAAAIPGESYSAGTFIWTQTQSSLPTTPANFDIGSIILRPNTAGTNNGVVLSPPSGISTEYPIVLPAQPSGTGVLTLSASGVMSAIQGTSGQYLAGGSTPAFTSFKAPTQTILTTGTSLTYTPPSGVFYLRIKAVSGGGGGGSCQGNGLGTGGGGGSATLFGSIISLSGANGGVTGDASVPGSGGAGGTATTSTGGKGWSGGGGVIRFY